VTQVVLDFRERYGVFLAGEADGVAFGSGASRAADAMDVISSVLWQIEVEDMAHVRNVQPTRSNVGSDQYREVPVVEVAQKA
jgi:hypothetical protein